MGELTHKATRAAFGKAIELTLKHVEKDREKGLLQLVDLTEKFMGDNFPSESYEGARNLIRDPESKWMQYVNRALDEIHPNVIKQTALNLGFEAAFHGTKTIRAMRKAAKPFSMGYLSGFQAERRDLEKEAFGAEIARDTEQYAKRVLANDMRGYTTVRPVHQQVGNRQERWRYALVPVWVMTYKGKNGKIYYYTINGQNGKVCGELPVDYKKLSLVSALITGVVFLLGLAGGLLL